MHATCTTMNILSSDCHVTVMYTCDVCLYVCTIMIFLSGDCHVPDMYTCGVCLYECNHECSICAYPIMQG